MFVEKKRILIVDDVAEYVQSLGRALSMEYDIEKTFNLEDAKKAMDNSISLCLVDIRLSEDDMSNRDGIIFLGWIKDQFPEVPVVMMSAYRDFDSAVDALNLHAAGYLKKPINLKELKRVIASFLDKEG
ncbi:MAG: response regulator [Candidatus Aminicenantes bacterium]|nr:response regulator [Candidatus Aminicenantes bacterium]NIM79114.1 response regulator [Candidatus Aminicenantes bacterium]NIN18399.1 response regulator [Candidatus Aminicenantes bacterium]NIN42287.1 response regulator [Candidatus Aminicenantes bacterium]NIN85053.1 response regulator [Candidatus Aminicenantes bacterium]